MAVRKLPLTERPTGVHYLPFPIFGFTVSPYNFRCTTLNALFSLHPIIARVVFQFGKPQLFHQG